MSRRAALLLALGLLFAALPAAAAEALTLKVSARETGRIGLRVTAQPGVELTLRDELTGEQRVLTPASSGGAHLAL